MNKETIVIALGGNALGNNLAEQRQAVAKTAGVIVDILLQNKNIVITHGNGPQVGMIQRAMDALAEQSGAASIPLPTSVAMSQGYIGIDLQNAIKYELLSRQLDHKVSTILSQVEVSPEDPAFQSPDKPIGRFMSQAEAEQLMANGIACMEDAGRGYRIVVPSPKPQRIRELETIKTLLNAGHIVITCGGGGIPVISDADGRLIGVNAVIDKDNASALLAEKLGADYLVILTAVEKVAINYGKPNQTWLSQLSTAEAEQYIAEGQFAKGSMLPKVEAALRFAQSGKNRKALITLLDKAADGIAGKTGTVIHS